jgi:hypothetical protein
MVANIVPVVTPLSHTLQISMVSPPTDLGTRKLPHFGGGTGARCRPLTVHPSIEGWLLNKSLVCVDMTSPKYLPIFTVGNTRYFFDRRVRQLRNIASPHDFVELSSLEMAVIEFHLAATDSIRFEAET